MTPRPKAWKPVGIVAGATAGALGFAYASPRILAAAIRHRSSPAEPSLVMPECDECFVETFDGARLRVLSRGEGPVLLLAHGVLLSARIWVRQFQDWPEQGFRVVAFGQRGHGLSSVGTAGHSIDNLAGDIRAVIEALDLDDVTLVGHSMGGFGALAFVLRHPAAASRLRGLVLLSTLSRSPMASAVPVVRRIMTTLARRGPDAARVLARPDLGFSLARLGLGRKATAENIEYTRAMLVATDPVTARDAVVSLLDFDLTPELGALGVPTLVIVGSADVLTPPREARRMAAAIPGAWLTTVAGGGHMLMLERPDELSRLVLDFVRSSSPEAERANG